MDESRSKLLHDPVTGQRRKKARYEQQYVRRSSRTASKAVPQYAEASGNSSSDNVSEQRNAGRKSDSEYDDQEQGEEESEVEIEEEQAPPVFQPHQSGQPVPPRQFGSLKTRPPSQLPEYISRVDYRHGKGATRRARTARRVDPRGLNKITYDYRFQTMFHLDFYSSVILSRTSAVVPSQWINWQHARDLQKSSIQSAISACERMGTYKIMQFQHDWCNEVIAQFYATLFVKEDVKRMHWMTEGYWHSVDYRTFAEHLGFDDDDFQKQKIHHEKILSPEQIGYMYPPGGTGVAVGKVFGIHPTYAYLNRMFRVTIDCKKSDRTTISDYSRNLLNRMAPNAQPFSVFDFIWHEIKSVGERPLKGCGYAPYIMHMIEQVTGHTFTYDQSHRPLRIQADLAEVAGHVPSASAAANASSGGATAGAACSPPHAPSRSTSCPVLLCPFVEY